MQIRFSKTKWIALCVGMLLMAGSAAPTRAESWFTFKSAGKAKVTDEAPGVNVPPPDDPASDDPAPERAAREPGANQSAVAGAEAPSDDVLCAADAVQCRRQRNCKTHVCRSGDPYHCSCYKPVNPWYCDPRDLQAYSAQGFNVPVTVPLAPMVQPYNYGWGIPSTRLSQAGNYTAWQPTRAYTQSGGRLPGGRYPTVYQPTDTTQLGYYYNYVPTWQPRW